MGALLLGAARQSTGAARSRRVALVDGKRRQDEWGASQTRKSLLPNQPKETEENEKPMKTNEFITALRATPNNRLIFAEVGGHAIHAGYHLTELKAASLQTVDCGGQVNQWPETIVQLWVPSEPDDEYMNVAKFLKIFDKVRGMIPLKFDAEIRIEYGDENFFPSMYHVRSVTYDGNVTRVLLTPPETTCKARNRRVARSSAAEARSCCASQRERCCAA